MVDVIWVSGNGIVQIARDAERFQTAAEQVCRRLAGVVRDNDAADEKAHAAEDVHKTQRILVVSDAEVSANLVLLDVVCVDGDDDLDIVDEALEHADFRIGFESWQDARGVMVIEKLAAEFKIELAAKLVYTVADVLCLQCDVLVVVESDAHEWFGPLSKLDGLAVRLKP